MLSLFSFHYFLCFLPFAILSVFYLHAYFPKIDSLILLAVADIISHNILMPIFGNLSVSKIKQYVLNICLVRNLFGKLL